MSLHPFLAELAAAGLYTPPPGRGGTNGATNGHYTHPAGPPPNPDDPTNQRYAHTALVSECTQIASTPEGGRNHALNAGAYSLGQLVASGFLAEADTRAALLDAGAAAGLPPLEVARTVESGFTAGLAVPRVVALRAVPAAYTIGPDIPLSAPVPDSPGQVPDSEPASPADQGADSSGQGADSSGLPRPLDWHQAFSGASEEIAWLIPDVLERGHSHALYASHKTGKSLITLYWCGQLIRAGRHVLYIDLENSVSDVVERLTAMGYGPDDLANLHYFSFPSLPALDSPAGGAVLLAMVEEYGADLVVLDTTSRVVAGAENDSDTFRTLYRYALVPLKAAGVTVLRLDHAGKDPTAGQRGSSAKGDDVDAVWLLIRHDDQRYQLKCDAQRSGHHPQFVDLVKHEEPLRFEPVTDPFSRPEVTVLVDHLDRLRVPNEAGRDTARTALTTAGIRARNGVLAEAIRVRKARLTSWDDLSGTGGTGVDLAKINNSCPQDQLEFPETAGHTCPGQVGDSGDSGTGVQKAAPVPISVRPEGGQMGTGGQDLSGTPPGGGRPEDQLCDRCRLPAERLIPSTRGKRICPVCAYPDPATRPGADTVELESE